jgi:hypothetical protein
MDACHNFKGEGSMNSQLSLISALLILLFSSPVALSQSGDSTAGFTLQVASFPTTVLAEQYIAHLTGAGERPAWGTVELPGRGTWTRIFIGSFKSVEAARRYADDLTDRGVIKAFLVKSAKETESLSRPRSVNSKSTLPTQYTTRQVISYASPALKKEPLKKGLPAKEQSSAASPHDRARGLTQGPAAQPWGDIRGSSRPILTTSLSGDVVVVSPRPRLPKPEALARSPHPQPLLLPAVEEVEDSMTPVDAASVTRLDPVRMAFESVTGRVAAAQGGLWVSGNRAEALERLLWIVGDENARLILIDKQGRVQVDAGMLARAAGIRDLGSLASPQAVTDYIYSNEGLLLLVQLTQGTHRFCLHLGKLAPTQGGGVEVGGSINLDNNYDSRINPYRRNKKKLSNERPPDGFDSLVAINPIARWFNLASQQIVPVGHITFHELAEAYAKLELDMDYLGHGARPGAHDAALKREAILKSQRPSSQVVVTTGSNRVLRTEEEIRQFYATVGATGGSQR